MATQTFETRTQDPADRLDYEINWQGGDKPFLAEDDVLTASSWTTWTDKWVATDDIVVDADSNTDTTSTAWVTFAGPTFAGNNYFITCHAVAASGREKDLSIKIQCKEQ